MPICKRCENKVSIWDVDAFGLCPDCSRAIDPDYVGVEEAARVLREDAYAKEATEKEKKAGYVRALNEGDLPELPCIMPKALKIQGNNLIFIHKRQNIIIPLQNIVGFSLKRPSLTSNGVITIQLQKGSDAFIALGNIGVGFGSEMTAVFKPKYLEIAELYEKHVLARNNTPQSVQAAPPANETVPTINDFRALKQLVDEGVLTEEEFAAKKKQLLGI